MPIFEYRCSACAEKFEKILFRETGEIECPRCGSKQTEKLLSSFAVQTGGTSGSREPAGCPCSPEQRAMCQRSMTH